MRKMNKLTWIALTFCRIFSLFVGLGIMLYFYTASLNRGDLFLNIIGILAGMFFVVLAVMVSSLGLTDNELDDDDDDLDHEIYNRL